MENAKKIGRVKSQFLQQCSQWTTEVDFLPKYRTEPNRSKLTEPNRTDTEVEIFFASNKSGKFGVYIYIYLLFSLNIDRKLSRVGKNDYFGKKILKISNLLPKFSAISSIFIKKIDLCTGLKFGSVRFTEVAILPKYRILPKQQFCRSTEPNRRLRSPTRKII